MFLQKSARKVVIETRSVFRRFAYTEDDTYEFTQKPYYKSCVSSIKSVNKGDDAGKYVIIDDTCFGKSIVIGMQDRISHADLGYDSDMSGDAIDLLKNVANKYDVCVIICASTIKIDPATGAKMLSNVTKATSMSKEMSKTTLTDENSEYNENVARDLKLQTRKSFKGKDRHSLYSLCASVIGEDLKIVTACISNMRAVLRQSGIRCEEAFFSQKEVMQSVLPSNFVYAPATQYAPGTTIATMSPLRNPQSTFSKDGIVVCQQEDTDYNIKICPSLKNSNSTFVMAPQGSGKTVFICAWASRAFLMGNRVLMVTPKADENGGANYMHLCTELGGQVIKIGDGNVCFNPLMVFIDQSYNAPSVVEYKKLLDTHDDIVKSFIAAWLGDACSERMLNKIYISLRTLYVRNGLINDAGTPINLERWTDGKYWPNFAELIEYFHTLPVGKSGDPLDASIAALLVSTIKADRKLGTLQWFSCSKERLDLANNFIVFDISGLSDSLKDAFSVLFMGAISLRYKISEGAGEKLRTYLFMDEIGSLLKTKGMDKYIEKAVREGRAAKLTTVVCTQDPEVSESTVNILKANCSNIFLLCNLSRASCAPFKKCFNLDDDQVESLIRQGTGIGLYLLKNTSTMIKVTLTEEEERLLFSEIGNGSNMTEKPGEYTIKPSAKYVFETRGFYIDDWVSGSENLPFTEWNRVKLQNPLQLGTVTVAIKNHIVETSDNKVNCIGPEGEKHYSWVNLIAERMAELGYEDIIINASDKQDITARTGDKTICVEVESQGTHSIPEYSTKYQAAADGFDIVIFTGTGKTCETMNKSDASVSVFPFGQSLANELEYHKP